MMMMMKMLLMMMIRPWSGVTGEILPDWKPAVFAGINSATD